MNRRLRAGCLTAAVERLPRTGLDGREERARVLAVIRDLVPFDAYAFLLTDPVTSVGCSLVAEVPDLDGENAPRLVLPGF